MSKECTTHHHACDCREEKFKQLEQENAALREDKERLANAAKEVLASYILTMRVELNHPCPENLAICRELRVAIDAAQKEAQS